MNFGSTRPEGSVIPSLTGLRFVAAALILRNHLLIGYVARDNPYFGPGLQVAGRLGMDVFFILSGFIIHYTYGAELASWSWTSTRKFFTARIARLYPLYIAVIVLDIGLSIYFGDVARKDIVRSLPFLLTGSQSWFYLQGSSGVTFAQILPRAGLTWSISTEFGLYLTYPLIASLLAWDRTGPRLRATIVLTLVTLLSLGLAAMWQVLIAEQAIRGYNASFVVWLTFVSPFGRFWQFLIGVLIAHLLSSGHRLPASSVITASATVYLFLFLLPPSQMPFFISAIMQFLGPHAAIAILIFSLATNVTTGASRFLSTNVLVRLGELSYSIYLLQLFVLQVMLALFGNGTPSIPKIALYWIVLIFASGVSFRYIEAPARKALRHLFNKKAKSASVC